MKFQGGVSEKDGKPYAIVKVNKEVLDVPNRARSLIPQLNEVFPEMSIVLVARDKKGKLFFFGRPDIVDGMGEVTISKIEWQEYELPKGDGSEN